MKDQIEKAIIASAVKAASSNTHVEAMQYSQAVVNLMNSLVALKTATK